MKIIKKECKICKKEFPTVSHSRKYCSVDCRNKSIKNAKEIKREKIKKYCANCKVKETFSKSHKFCKECHKQNMKNEYSKHKKRSIKSSAIRYNKLKDNKDYRAKNNNYLKGYLKNRRAKDKEYNISCRLRCLFYYALKKYSQNGKMMSSKKYGLNWIKIIESLKPFPEDLSKYHIDHIKPLSSFNLNNKEEIKKAFDPKNLQWLEASENISKGNKLNWKKQNI
ncbi:hypothetical protein DRN73_09700 [Candidatus Pacearchaeota archaeon]|nr:MAG: hypothetical protein DRN73_09700 [Candidatus Pacearchaeota archaeon]